MNKYEQNKLEVLKFLSSKTSRIGILPSQFVNVAQALKHQGLVKADAEMGWNITVQGRDELERLAGGQ